MSRFIDICLHSRQYNKVMCSTVKYCITISVWTAVALDAQLIYNTYWAFLQLLWQLLQLICGGRWLAVSPIMWLINYDNCGRGLLAPRAVLLSSGGSERGQHMKALEITLKTTTEAYWNWFSLRLLLLINVMRWWWPLTQFVCTYFMSVCVTDTLHLLEWLPQWNEMYSKFVLLYWTLSCHILKWVINGL